MNGKQKYKIYINSTKVILKPTDKVKKKDRPDDVMVARYNGGVKHLMNFIDMCEKSDRYRKIIIHYFDYNKLYDDFISLFNIVPAGGGLVRNDKGKFLFIFRRGNWDLPKGKLEHGENIEEAALREVEEETGMQGLVLVDKICVTYHTYRNAKKKRLIKKSVWYYMTCEDQEIIPQIEEDIERAVWTTLEDMKSQTLLYDSIRDVIKAFEHKKS